MESLSTSELQQAAKTLGLLARMNYPLSEGLARMGQDHEAWVLVGEDISKGSSLGSSLQRYPRVFSPFFSRMVKAAEESEESEAILTTLSKWLEISEQVRSKTRNLLHYPILLLSFLMAEVGLLLLIAMPGIVLPAVYIQDGMVPESLVQISTVGGYLAIILGALMAVFSHRTEWLLKYLPMNSMFRRTVFKADQSLWLRAVAAFLQAGLPLPEALERSHQVVWSRSLDDELSKLAPKLREGSAFSQALSEIDIVEPQIKWAITAGEAKEDLSGTLLFAAERMEKNLLQSCRTFLTLLQPAAVLSVGLMTTLVISPFWWSIYYYGRNLAL